MKYLFLLVGSGLIIWSLYSIRQANGKLVREQARCASDLKEIAGELQTFAEAIIAEMEVEAAKLRELLADSRQARAEAVRPIELPAAEAVGAVEVKAAYPDPIPLAEHAERKKHRSGGKRNEKILAADGKYQRVLELAAAGWPEGEIARVTGIGKGEVQLILQLRK